MPDQKPWERYAAPSSEPHNGQYEEGDIADGPNGQTLVFRGGQWVPQGAAQPRGIIIKQDNPYELPKDQAQLDNTRANASRTRAELPYVADKAAADAQRARNDAAKSGFDLAGARSSRSFDRADKLRADYEALPSVKNYTQALPVFGAGLRSTANPAGDLNLIYAYAKVMDPNSVVREGEQASVANADTWLNAKTAQLQKQLGSGGTFKPEFRQALRSEMAGRMGELNQSFIADRVKYKQIADRYQVDPRDVVGDHPGERFQELSKTVLGRDQQHLDYSGHPIAGTTSPRPIGGMGGTIAGGDTKVERDPDRERVLDKLLRAGVPLDTINATSKAMGGMDIPEAEYSRMRDYVTRNPDDTRNTFDTSHAVPTSAWNRFAASPTGTGIYAAIDAGFGGTTDEIASAFGGGDLADLNARKQGAFAENPKAAFAGQAVGAIGAMTALGSLGRSAGIASRFVNPQFAGDLAFGAFSGAGQSNDNRMLGATLGTAGAAAGNVIGAGVASGVGAAARTQPGIAMTNTARGLFGRGSIPAATPLAPGQSSIAGALNRAGPDDVAASLTEAQSLGVPMSLADTNPHLRELAGAAVRRSPSAAQVAEDALLSRSRGQYDRFTGSVESNLGPSANIPQLSADLTQQARTQAAPLYDAAYAAPGASSVDLSDILNRPLSMKPALSRARSIAEEEGRDPTALGFDLNDQGETVLGRVPSFQTLDYAKRGLDDILEPHRNDITGKLQLNEATRAINNTKNTLLDRIDAVNPEYKAARGSYAGPTSSRDALARGGDAYSLSPQELAMQVVGQSPEHLGQMQLGYRGAMVDHAGRVRDSSNPWDATLGSPVARQRLGTMYPSNPGVDRLARQAELEKGMQQTTNAVLGNSRTARNLIADEDFAGSPMIENVLHAGAAVATHGASIPGSAARFAGAGLRDGIKLGVGKRAAARADQIAPVLMDTDPAAALGSVRDLLERETAWRQFVAATTPKRLGMFGAGFGSQAALAPINR